MHYTEGFKRYVTCWEMSLAKIKGLLWYRICDFGFSNKENCPFYTPQLTVPNVNIIVQLSVNR